jgi:hypothetical protein
MAPFAVLQAPPAAPGLSPAVALARLTDQMTQFQGWVQERMADFARQLAELQPLVANAAPPVVAAPGVASAPDINIPVEDTLPPPPEQATLTETRPHERAGPLLNDDVIIAEDTSDSASSTESRNSPVAEVDPTCDQVWDKVVEYQVIESRKLRENRNMTAPLCITCVETGLMTNTITGKGGYDCTACSYKGRVERVRLPKLNVNFREWCHRNPTKHETFPAGWLGQG